MEVHEVEREIRVGNTVTRATFKWSRDNGSVVFPIVSLAGATVVVTSLGRDQCSLLQPGDWVEVCDDVLALREQSGPLAQVQTVDREELKITLKWPDKVAGTPSYAEGDTPSKHPFLRRWDHAGDLAVYHGALLIVEEKDTWIELEDGVQIWFANNGEYRPGDYWMIPARVATGDVEWPLTLDNNGVPRPDAPVALPPHGPRHYYAPLTHVKPNIPAVDCRCRIPTVPCKPADGA